MTSCIYFLLTLCFIQVCYTDIRYRIINNYTTIIITVLSGVLGCLFFGGILWVPALSILFIGFVLSLINLVGAGDIKLLAGLSLSFSSQSTITFLFLTTLAGLLVALCVLAISHFVAKGYNSSIKTVPYGLAIVGGYAATTVFIRVVA